jgi:hypothetical protein
VDLNFLKLVITLRLEADYADPYLLFGMRTDFAEIFREATSCSRKSCDQCPDTSACPLQQIFAQTLSPVPSAVKRFQKPPLPFVFDLPLLPPAPNRGRAVEIGITLAGLATNHVVCFLNAVRLYFGRPASRRRLFAAVSKVDSIDYTGNRSTIAGQGSAVAPDRLVFLSMAAVQSSVLLPPDSVSLSVTTPLCLLKDGRPLRELSFSALLRSLLRRMSAISFHYGGIDLELDYRWLAERSSQIECSSGEFTWIEWNKNLYGIIGRGTFTGDLTDFHPFLLFGEYFHAGKGATYGLGRYRLEKAG